ncbi:MAG: methyltransferase domain-containing protein [Bacteroidia bacterium]|nr:methyltransferase domain-containing protein [Bacteroidia bacterium]
MATTFDKQFFEIFEKDKAFIKSWLVAWDYQLKRKKRNVKYAEGQLSDFFSYNGPEDLTKWMRWFSPVYPSYFSKTLTQPLSEESLENDRRILSGLNLNYDFSSYHNNVGLNNAHDLLIPQLYPVPERNQIKTILDFGAGYGRQANLWTSKTKDATYIGMDAIPNSYTLQNLYYNQLTSNVYDYIDSPGSFKFSSGKKGIYHVPTWRSDLIPADSVDMVMCVQVLPELNTRLVKHMLVEFERMLKPGGMLYIRDHYEAWKPAGNFSINSFLNNNGFVLEFKPHIILDKDLHGIPKIWRKADPEVMKSLTRPLKAKIKQLAEDADALSGGLLAKLKRSIK